MKHTEKLLISSLVACTFMCSALYSYGKETSPGEALPAPLLLTQHAKMDVLVRKPFTLNAEQSFTNNSHLGLESGAKIETLSKSADLSINRFALKTNRDYNDYKMLAGYNVELIVDRSLSMRKPDCPDGLSRWQWCGEQAADLARSLAPYAPSGVTVIPFATEYDVFEHSTAQNIGRLFNGIGLQRGTRLFEPLAERLDTYFAHNKPNSKPLLIIVITDGVLVPRFEPQLVRNALVDASQKMTSSGQVTLIFCQIGEQDRLGRLYLTDLGQNLTSYGARYPFVHTISFDELQEKGLGPALIASIKRSNGRHAYKPDQDDSDFDAPASRKFDRFADDPLTDADGVRHFENGKHFNLNRMTLGAAIELTGVSPQFQQQYPFRYRR